MNVKRTYRGLSRRGTHRSPSPPQEVAGANVSRWFGRTHLNDIWSLDFVFDELASGQRIKTLTVVGDCTKESVSIIADTSIPAAYVTRTLDRIKAERGLPRVNR